MFLLSKVFFEAKCASALRTDSVQNTNERLRIILAESDWFFEKPGLKAKLTFHKKWPIISSITDLYIIYVVSTFITKIINTQKSWNLFHFLFTFLKCALHWANSKRKLIWNETIAIRGTKPFKPFYIDNVTKLSLKTL